MNQAGLRVNSKDPIVRIRTFVSQTFPLVRRRTIADSDNLLESGVIDSLGVLELVTFLQSEFALQVDDDELTPENFESVDSIARFVKLRLQIQ
jgi:acyl carrier protein